MRMKDTFYNISTPFMSELLSPHLLLDLTTLT